MPATQGDKAVLTRGETRCPEPVKVWCLLGDQHAHVEPVRRWFGADGEFVVDEAWRPEDLVAARPDVVICVNDYPYDIARCLDAARAARIPSLVLQDGILEWRCQYENPLFGAGGGAPQHQPVIADKIACLGNQSARQIAAWGNASKVEVTGMPRLDGLLTRQWLPRQTPGKRILVMTAKKAAFTPEQLRLTLQSLADLRDYFGTQPGLEVRWRVSRDVARELGIENQLKETSSTELAKLLDQVDAVVTTPSTAMLETMLADRPVAALDYHNVPRFVSTAWTISAQSHIAPVISELLNPAPRKMAFQRDCLADALRLDGPAAAHVGLLLRRMAEAGRAARVIGAPLDLKPDLLGLGARTQVFLPPPLCELYPEHKAFSEEGVRSLQVRLARAERDLESWRKANKHLRRVMSPLLWFRDKCRRLTRGSSSR